jgi:hypothetical protein
MITGRTIKNKIINDLILNKYAKARQMVLGNLAMLQPEREPLRREALPSKV